MWLDSASFFITPNWPNPPGVRAYSTLRTGGYSLAPYHSFNLGMHSGDDPATVLKNRAHLKQCLGLKHAPVWMQQVHGADVVQISDKAQDRLYTADAAYTAESHIPCVVLTADCLPILLAHVKGKQVAAIHAGWRGIVAGVIEHTLDRLKKPYDEWMVWLGPAIGPQAFEVSDDVKAQLTAHHPDAQTAFKATGVHGKWYANLYQLAIQRLRLKGMTHIYGGTYCTKSDHIHFYSYRRDGEKTGRMATLIWIE